ncbi:MAG: hypothetical protein A3D87_03030 [Omnitrophica WOR_2 bacterium RIFCSPHIGHO2_02_FULL_50_17]|nr:MAG: hypothetical protein A3D87_03030 [Omnitrophica WOR_2 bacterium RIFCSPHIGHO2_02_FULL_50_17]
MRPACSEARQGRPKADILCVRKGEFVVTKIENAFFPDDDFACFCRREGTEKLWKRILKKFSRISQLIDMKEVSFVKKFVKYLPPPYNVLYFQHPLVNINKNSCAMFYATETRKTKYPSS